MMRSCLVAVVMALLLGAPAARGAGDYTDSWWIPAEPGWGVNLTQQAGFVYATFFVYALDGKSTWFTGLQLIAMYLIMAITVFAIPV